MLHNTIRHVIHFDPSRKKAQVLPPTVTIDNEGFSIIRSGRSSNMPCWLCKTDEVVTNTQSPCKNNLCQICIAVSNLDEEINQAAATLQRLVAKRSDLLSEHNRVTDPMRRLPVELQNYTFQLVLPAQDEWCPIYPFGRTTRIVIRLMSICKHWRDIALSNPFLWSTIRIWLEAQPALKYDFSGWLNFVHDGILRSRTLPLTLQIYIYSASEEEWRRILDIISPSSARWHSFFLDLPDELLGASHHKDLQFTRLRSLQITSSDRYYTGPVPLFNPTMSPEEIDIRGLSFQALQISWNRLTIAQVENFVLEEIVQLFQHASQMTVCRILEIGSAHESFSMPAIIHRRLKVLSLLSVKDDMAALLLGSLTLPCLHEFHTAELYSLTPAYLPALVHRSSCPLTSIRLSGLYEPPDLQPFPGVTDLVVENLVDPDAVEVEQLLLEHDYFPDLRRLTLSYASFLFLWQNGLIRRLLDRKGRRPDASNEGGLHKILVVDQHPAVEIDEMWNTDVGKDLKELNIILREDGFEIISPNENTCSVI